ncbi:hypothetical protein CAJAP_09503 [Camponotus japonicus]
MIRLLTNGFRKCFVHKFSTISLILLIRSSHLINFMFLI